MAISAERTKPARSGQGPSRTRPPLRPPQPWELELLHLIAEQRGIPFDQLARFIGCEAEQAVRRAEHLAKAGYAEYGRFLIAEPHWIWLTGRGARLSGTGFGPGAPGVGAMARIRATNEVRLLILRRAPEASWVCSRRLTRELGKHCHRPNAVVQIGSERHAILVQLRAAEQRRTRSVLEAHMARYDAVVAFAAPRPRRLLERLAAEHHWPKLFIRDLPLPAQPSDLAPLRGRGGEARDGRHCTRAQPSDRPGETAGIDRTHARLSPSGGHLSPQRHLAVQAPVRSGPAESTKQPQ